MSSRPRLVAALACLSLSTALFFPRSAHAEKILVKGDNWDVYTDGRAGAFLSWTVGDGQPVSTGRMIDTPSGPMPESINGGGWLVSTTDGTETTQGKVNTMRVRSGYIGNTLGVGVRSEIYPGLKASTYIQVWAVIEPDGRNKGTAIPADFRQGYAKLEGFWGSFLAGRTRTLFSRGATDINVLYAHRWGVGMPDKIDSTGPTRGMVGFGVLGSGFAPGFIYGTPVLGGFQLNVGIFDPATMSAGALTRTQLPRAEAEATFERPLGSRGKVVLFANGAYQKVYRAGACTPSAASGACDGTLAGVGYGGRLEVGPVHLGVAGHFGQGLGLNYALEQSPQAIDAQSNLRTFDGYYLQSQVVLGRFDLFAGAGITRLFLTDYDKTQPQVSNVKNQIGYNAGVVYNLSENVHFDLEYMRAESHWFLDEKQILNNFASGMIVNW